MVEVNTVLTGLSSNLSILGIELTWDVSFFMGLMLVTLIIMFRVSRLGAQAAESSQGAVGTQRRSARLRYFFLIVVAICLAFVSLRGSLSTSTALGKSTSDSDCFTKVLDDMIVKGCRERSPDDLEVTLQSFGVAIDGVDRQFRRSEDGKFRDALDNVWEGK